MLDLIILSTMSVQPPGRGRMATMHRLRSTFGRPDEEPGSPLRARVDWSVSTYGLVPTMVVMAWLTRAEVGHTLWDPTDRETDPELRPYDRNLLSLFPWLVREVRDASRRGEDPWAWLVSSARTEPGTRMDLMHAMIGSLFKGEFPELLELTDLLDWYREERPRPDILTMSLQEAFDASRAWHERFVPATEGAPRPGEVLYRSEEHPGWTVQRLSTRKQIEEEGKALGHCVGGRHYYDRSIKGEIDIHSLRDPDGRSWATWELILEDPGGPRIGQLKSVSNKPLCNTHLGTPEQRTVARELALEWSRLVDTRELSMLPDRISELALRLDEGAIDSSDLTQRLVAAVACPECGSAPDTYVDRGAYYYRVRVEDGVIELYSHDFQSDGVGVLCQRGHDYWPDLGDLGDFYEHSAFL